jgi:hypothetical protein
MSLKDRAALLGNRLDSEGRQGQYSIQ